MRIFLVLLAVFVLSACGTAVKHADDSAGDAARFGSGATYRIGVDDVLQVSVWRNPELSVTVPVRPDGKISVPLIGDVPAGGLMPMEVAAIIKEKLNGYIRDPSVAVILSQLHSHEFLSRVRIVGAVRQPRSLTYRQGMTVLDAVLEAGGINEFASANRTKLHRKLSGDKAELISIKLGDILSNGDTGTNVDLRPGDVISIPERIF